MEELEDLTWDEDIMSSESNVLKNQDVPEKQHLQVLLSKFGYTEFRPMQWKIINSIMNHRQDNLTIMATGYGKSLCYQYPPVFMGGTSLVISPLISLMEDQVLALRAKGITSCLLGTANKEPQKTTNEILNNKYSLVYLTPEFCTRDTGLNFLREMNEMVLIRLIAIDEAHCVSFWGHDFRRSYQQLGILKNIIPDVPILGLTATATPLVKKEIIKVLRLKNPQVLCAGLDRPNLYFAVFPKGSDIFLDIKQFLKRENGSYKFDGPTIIYTTTKEKTEQINYSLKERGISCGFYHAGINLSERKQVHKQFIMDEIDVIVATIAFGMGIDKPNIRNVIHYGCPGSLEGYYQEAGRAGRDGLPSKCIMFHNSQDFVVHRLLRQNLQQKVYMIKVKMMDIMENYLYSSKCRRKLILSYFEGKDVDDVDVPANSICCDNCVKGKEESIFCEYEGVNEKGLYNFTDDVKKFLSIFLVVKFSYGMATFIDFIRGLQGNKFKKYIKNPLFGSGKDKNTEWWKEIANICLKRNFLYKKFIRGTNFNYEAIEITTTGKQFLGKNDKILEAANAKICSFLKSKSGIWITNSGASTSTSIKPNSSGVCSLNTGSNVLQEEDFHTRMHLIHLLKKKRDEIANEKNCAIYSIASDKALRDFACKKPLTLGQLKDCEVDDFTNDQINAYGEAFVNIIRENIPKKTIKDILLHHPLATQKTCNSTQQISYTMFSQGLSVTEIAEKRGLAESTIQGQLVQLLKNGVPIKLSQLGVTTHIKNIIVEAIEKTGMESLADLKKVCPDDISYGQIKAVQTYFLIREHLDKLGIPYEDYEDFKYQELRYVNNSDDEDNLTQLINGLKDIQDKDESVQQYSKENEHEETCKFNVNDESNRSNDGHDMEEFGEDLDITDDDLLLATEEMERSFNEPDAKKVKISESISILDSPPRSAPLNQKTLQNISANTSTLDSPYKTICSASTSSKFHEEEIDSKRTLDLKKQEVKLFENDKDMLFEFDIQERENKDTSLDELSILDSPPRFLNKLK